MTQMRDAVASSAPGHVTRPIDQSQRYGVDRCDARVDSALSPISCLPAPCIVASVAVR